MKRRTGEWMRSLSRGLWVSLVLSLALAACSAPAAPEPTAPPTAVPPTQTPVPSATPQPLVLSSPTPRVRCEVVAWLDNDTPQVGDQLTLTASLSVNGYLSSASWMKATWPDENAPGGRKVCWDTPSYGRGFCDIRVTDQYTPGQPVYITVELFRQGVWHSGQVHFTPQ